MTEEEWVSRYDPSGMLGFLGTKVTDRKLQLFAVACCRRIWHLLTDERVRKVVEVLESYTDYLVSDAEMTAAFAIDWKLILRRISVQNEFRNTPFCATSSGIHCTLGVSPTTGPQPSFNLPMLCITARIAASPSTMPWWTQAILNWPTTSARSSATRRDAGFWT